MPGIKPFNREKALETANLTGMHNAKIASAKQDISKVQENGSGGNLGIRLSWVFNTTTDEGEQEQRVFDGLWFTEKALYRIINAFDALGWGTERLEGHTFDPRDPAEIAFVQELATDLIGEEASIKVSMKPGTPDEHGEMRPDLAQVDRYFAYGEAKTSKDLLADL